MPRRERLTSFRCAEPGCGEHISYTYRSQREYQQIHRNQKTFPFRCSRHQNPDQVLRPDNPERVTVLVATRIPRVPDRLFWVAEGDERGHANGINRGSGYVAHADDFPEGTRLVVTARVKLPEGGEQP